MSILSWFIAAQGHETDPDCHDLSHPKMAGFDRPLAFWIEWIPAQEWPVGSMILLF
jgi:hypothetical protein